MSTAPAATAATQTVEQADILAVESDYVMYHHGGRRYMTTASSRTIEC